MDLDMIVNELIAPYDNATTMSSITATTPGFDSAARLRCSRRSPRGAAGGHAWNTTVFAAVGDWASVQLQAFVQPRIEPEVCSNWPVVSGHR
jgi:hypothetical protein